MELLQISPAVLTFTPPLENRNVNALIKLENISNTAVTFKVKTTAPKRYHVQPTSGIIAPHQTADIKVTLSISRDPPQSNKVRDRFQVLSMPVPSNAAAQPLKEIWKAADPNQVIKQRLKCVLPLTRGGDEGDDTTMIDDADAASVLHQPTTDDADEHTNPIEASTSSSTAMNESLSFEPAIELAVPAVQPASTESLDLPDLDTLPSEVQTKFEDLLQRLAHVETERDRAKAVVVTLKNTIDGLTSASVTSDKEKRALDERLGQYKTEIQTLKQQLQAARSGASGVPLPIVIAIVVLAIVLAFVFPVKCFV